MSCPSGVPYALRCQPIILSYCNALHCIALHAGVGAGMPGPFPAAPTQSLQGLHTHMAAAEQPCWPKPTTQMARCAWCSGSQRRRRRRLKQAHVAAPAHLLPKPPVWDHTLRPHACKRCLAKATSLLPHPHRRTCSTPCPPGIPPRRTCTATA